ncbi:MAG: AraC family transcriptional regulator [Bacteroidetes bacterium]|nr:MAG: AraC family transcriptional regulator [Bacteroidota bacterium]
MNSLSILKPTILHIGPFGAWFLGEFNENKAHSHYAIQIAIPFGKRFTVETEGEVFTESVLIPPATIHKLTSEGPQLTILLSPTTSHGHYWKAHLKDSPSPPPEGELKTLKAVIERYYHDEIDKKECISSINRIIESWNCRCEGYIHGGDSRIEDALNYLEGQSYRSVPIGEVAQHVHLSVSRFQHLFTEQTGQTYRRALLWMKIVAAAPLFGKLSLTEIAHEVGFSDSAHLSRTFTDTFGFSPRQIQSFNGGRGL